jgi:hypothetical protein
MKGNVGGAQRHSTEHTISDSHMLSATGVCAVDVNIIRDCKNADEINTGYSVRF